MKLRTFELALVNVTSDGEVKTTYKEYALPVNVTIETANCSLRDGLQHCINRVRMDSFIYKNNHEGKKNVPNESLITLYNVAMDRIDTLEADIDISGLSDEELDGLHLMAYCLDSATHSTYFNGKRVMRIPSGGTDVISAFSAYEEGRIAFKDLKATVLDFSDKLNRIPFLRNRTMKMTDDDLNDLIAMHSGKGQVRRWNKHGINARKVTKDKLIEQIVLMELERVFKFEELETVKRNKVVEF